MQESIIMGVNCRGSQLAQESIVAGVNYHGSQLSRESIVAGIQLSWSTHGGPVAQPWRRLSRPKSRSRRSRNGDRWAAIACIAQLGASP